MLWNQPEVVKATPPGLCQLFSVRLISVTCAGLRSITALLVWASKPYWPSADPIWVRVIHHRHERVQGACRVFCPPHKGPRKSVYWSVEWCQHSYSQRSSGPLLLGELNGVHIAEWILKEGDWFQFRCRVSPEGTGSIIYSFYTSKHEHW